MLYESASDDDFFWVIKIANVLDKQKNTEWTYLSSEYDITCLNLLIQYFMAYLIHYF